MTDEQRANVKLWIEALRSGEYEQGTGGLRDAEGSYCCLGVACEVHQNVAGGLRLSHGADGWMRYNDKQSFLPLQVQEWIGLASPPGNIDLHGKPTTLYALNDHRHYTFAQIADVIELALNDPSMKLFA